MGYSKDQPLPQPTGEEPTIYKPKTPMIPRADTPQMANPVQPEQPTNGIPVDSAIPQAPGRPRAAIPYPPGAPTPERVRTPRVRTQKRK